MSKTTSYIIGAIQIVAGVIISIVSWGSLGPLGVSLIISGVATIVGTALSKPAGADGGFSKSNTYGFDSLSNAAFDGVPKAVVLGRHIVAPKYVSVQTIQDGKEQYLKAVMHVCSGGSYGIESISTIEINSETYSHFDDVELEYRLGHTTAQTLSGYDVQSIPYAENVFMDEDIEFIRTTRGEVDELGIAFVWQSGLYQTGSKGDIYETKWVCTVEYSENDGDDWDDMFAPSNKTSGWERDPKISNYWVTYGKGTGVKRRMMTLKWDTKAERLIRITSKRGNTSKKKRVPYLNRIEERVYEAVDYSGDAIIAFTVPAQGQLSGGLPKVTCIVEG